MELGKKCWVLLIAVGLMAAGLGVGSGARADVGTGIVPVSVPISAHFDDPGFLVMTPACDPAKPTLCTLDGDGGATFTGDLAGTSTYHAVAVFNPAIQGADFYAYETFSGTVSGCGTGSVSWVVHGVINRDTASQYDPVTGTIPLDFDLQITDGSGTGQLAGITGWTTGHGTINPLTRENHGDLSGQIVCGSTAQGA